MVRLKNSNMDGTRSTHSYNVTASVSRFVLVENHNHQFRDKNKYKVATDLFFNIDPAKFSIRPYPLVLH